MRNISNYQLFLFMVICTMGDTTIYVLASDASRDAWLAVIIGALIGTFFLFIYVQLQNLYPDKNLSEIIIDLCGKIIGVPLALLYIMHFLYQTARTSRDFGELIGSTFLENTPPWVIHAVFISIVCYVIYLGYEPLVRTSEILTPIYLLFIFFIFIMIILSGKVDFSANRPVLTESFTDIVKAAFPSVTIWPFGESAICFLMFWKYSKDKQKIFRICTYAFALSSSIIALSGIIIISTLGLEYGSSSTLALLEVLRNINIADIITNLDAIGILILFIGGFYKNLTFFFAGILAFASLIKIKDYRWLIIPFGIFNAWFSIAFEPNVPYHIWLGLAPTMYYLHPAFILIMPILLLFIALMKKSINKTAILSKRGL